MGYSLKRKLATLVILAVSASAFVAGYLQTQYIDTANEFFEKSQENETNVIRIEQEAKRRYDFDLTQDSQATVSIFKAQELAFEYAVLEDDFTDNEKFAKLGIIYLKLQDVNYYLFNSNAYDIFDHFFGT